MSTSKSTPRGPGVSQVEREELVLLRRFEEGASWSTGAAPSKIGELGDHLLLQSG